MSKEKEIRELCKLICHQKQQKCDCCVGALESGECCWRSESEKIYNAGYRKLRPSIPLEECFDNLKEREQYKHKIASEILREIEKYSFTNDFNENVINNCALAKIFGKYGVKLK